MIPSRARVWIAMGYTDMRRGMHGLSLQVQEGLKRDPNGGDLFVFRGRSGSLVKILWHDGVGLSLTPRDLSANASLANGLSTKMARIVVMDSQRDQCLKRRRRTRPRASASRSKKPARSCATCHPTVPTSTRSRCPLQVEGRSALMSGKDCRRALVCGRHRHPALQTGRVRQLLHRCRK